VTLFEVVTIAIAVIAALISLYTLREQRRLQRESNDLQRATAELAKKQLEVLVREDSEKTKARCKLDLVRDGKGFRFVITNISTVDAMNVGLRLILSKSSDSPIIESEGNEKLPAPKIAPGNSVSLIAALHMGSPTAYNAEVFWINPDGTEAIDRTYVSL